jgi:hypothetical protein
MTRVVADCAWCGSENTIWSGAHFTLYDPMPKEAAAAVMSAASFCWHCRLNLIGSMVGLRNLPAELRPYEQMTSRPR